MIDTKGTTHRFVRRRTARIVGVLLAAGAVSLMLASCGASSAPNVADSGTTTTTTAGAQGGGGSDLSRTLSYAQCMRTKGVANFPDPLSDGEFDKQTLSHLAETNSHYGSANQSCSHLLPSGTNGTTPALAQEIYSDEMKFVRCMHTHGVANWPNPTLEQGRYIFDPQAFGIDPNTPQMSSKMQTCDYVFPASVGVPPGVGHNP